MNYRMDGTIYLLHIDPPYKHARHYLGWTPGDVEERVQMHLDGKGAGLVRAAIEAGCTVTLVRTWIGGHDLERIIHDRKDNPILCPICNPKIKSTWQFDLGYYHTKKEISYESQRY